MLFLPVPDPFTINFDVGKARAAYLADCTNASRLLERGTCTTEELLEISNNQMAWMHLWRWRHEDDVTRGKLRHEIIPEMEMLPEANFLKAKAVLEKRRTNGTSKEN
jgi:hypothetical protein